MSEFTKGPWSQGWGEGLTGPTTPNSGHGPTVAGRGALFIPIFTRMKTLAIVVTDIKKECEANAALIAAAPELYEALKAVISDYGYSNMSEQDLLSELVAGNETVRCLIQARATLAKASP